MALLYALSFAATDRKGASFSYLIAEKKIVKFTRTTAKMSISLSFSELDSTESTEFVEHTF